MNEKEKIEMVEELEHLKANCNNSDIVEILNESIGKIEGLN